jgi:hypothetical protein
LASSSLANDARAAASVSGVRAREREGRRRELRARLDVLDAEAKAAGQVGADQYLRGLRTICKDWKTLLRADAVHGLRDLRIEKVVVRRDDQGRWSYRLEGDLSKIAGVDGRHYAVSDEPFSTWIDESESSEIAEPGLARLPGFVPPGRTEASYTVPVRAIVVAV